MRVIKEVIIVEGKHDIAFLKTFLDALFIETNGLSLPNETKKLIKELSIQGKEFIVLTDPDFPGEKIRKEIETIVPNCKHAFVRKQKAISKNHKKVGVEHTTREEILKALESMISYEEKQEKYSYNEFFLLGFVGQENSKKYRDELSNRLNLGSGSSKTILKRLNALNKTKQEIDKIIKEIVNG